MQTMNETLSYYNENTASFVESTQSVKMTEAWKKFTSRLDPASLILDFGCGSGRDTKYFLEHGFQVEAIDGSEELCKAASEYTGINVRHQLFQEWKSEAKYNGIWACSSILHLNKQELKQVLEKIKEALLPSGLLYTSFKSKNYKHVLFVAHREEILSQAATSFANVRCSNDYGFFNGKVHDTDKSVIFASVASLGKDEYLNADFFTPASWFLSIITESMTGRIIRA